MSIFQGRSATSWRSLHSGCTATSARTCRLLLGAPLILPLLLLLLRPGGLSAEPAAEAFRLAEAKEQVRTGIVRGRVVAEENGRPIPGVSIRLDGTRHATATNSNGSFRIEGVPLGEHLVVFEQLGRHVESIRIEVTPEGTVAIADPSHAALLAQDVIEGDGLHVALRIRAIPISPLVISATGEAQRLSETAATVSTVSGAEIRLTRPTHPSEIMGKVPGVWVNVTGGEGHMTSIRQPLTTEPVYLYLSDGVPTRSTGFFNHNALYEINVPAAESIEVIKGPTTALHGSDAIGGTINVSTRPAMAAPGLELSLEGGGHGFARLLGSYGVAGENQGLRADMNVTRTDGWRDGTAYDRQSGTLRWDRILQPGASLKAILSLSRIDQNTAGSSALPESAYMDAPTRNLTPVSFREVQAARLSVEYERIGQRTLFSLTPFVRYNAMEMLPNWSLTYDPVITETSNRSVGLLARYRRSFQPLDARVIVGVDLDRSPGERFELGILPVTEGPVFQDFMRGEALYDYRVTFMGVSPYLHAEASPLDRLRLTAGLRFDHIGYDYDNRLGTLQGGFHRRPGSTEVRFSRFSPKLGATYDVGGGTSVFASYGQGFRAPAEGQLFRQGVAANTVGLEPVVATNYEVGARGSLGGARPVRDVHYALSAYRMVKSDDILSFQREDDVRETRNAGRSLHRGIEAEIGSRLPGNLAIQVAFSYAEHEYLEWQPTAEVDFSGNTMVSAPRTMGNTTLSWTPSGLEDARVALGWSHLGTYWLNAENTERYRGHDLVTLNASLPVSSDITLFAKVNNVTDVTYAESGGFSQFRGREFAPGLPRTFYAGARMTLGGAR